MKPVLSPEETFNEDLRRRSRESAIYFTEPTMTEQHHKDSCDINNIMSRYTYDQIAAHALQYGGDYGDFTSGFDYHDACNQIIAARDMFMTLPASVRARFDNDPGKFLEFATNPSNLDDMRKMGLCKPSAQNTSVEPVKGDLDKNQGGTPP